MAAEYIKIKRAGYKWNIKRELTEEERKNSWRHRQKTVTETLDIAQAKIISPRSALFQYEKGSLYIESRYHVIHIPTGLVIADVPYDLVKDVKNTFEKSKWTFKKGSRNILRLVEGTMQFEMTCNIKYEIVKE